MSFPEDTKISCLDGTERKISDLQDPLWVYSYRNGRIIPSLAASRAIRESPLFSIEIDNQEVVQCSSDQIFLLRGGKHKAACDLAPGDSLMPLYRKLGTPKELPGYERVSHPGTRGWQYTHRMVAAEVVGGAYDGEVVHHIDFNKRNNVPENLQVMSWEAHTQLHQENTRLLNEYAQSERGRERSREVMKALHANPEWEAKSLERIRQNGHITTALHMKKGQFGFGSGLSKEQNSEAGRKGGRKGKGRVPSQKARENMSKAQLAVYLNPELGERKIRSSCANLAAYNLKLASGELSITEAQRKARSQNGLHCAYRRFHEGKGVFASFEEYLSSRHPAPVNHKVVSVTAGRIKPCYELHANDPHNLALSAGIFVCNNFW